MSSSALTAPLDGTVPRAHAPDRPIRVCMLAETFYPVLGGCETQARLLADELTARGHPVLFVTRRSDPSLPRRDRLGSVRISRVGPAGPRGALRWPILATGIVELFQQRREFDILLVLGFRALGLGAIPFRALGKPCVLKAESNGEMSGAFFGPGLQRLGFGLTSPLVRFPLAARNRLLAHADAFVAISSEIRAELQAAGVEPTKVEQIPNAVDTDRFSPVDPPQRREIRARLGFGPDEKIVTYTGRLVSYKGLPGLLRVWSRVAAAIPESRLVLVGPGGLDIHNCEEELRTFVRENGLAERVHFTGGVENVHEYLQASDCFVFPTENEAFGASLIEAMACGLPCVATRTGGIPDILTDGEDGLLVAPGDELALERELRWLLAHPAEAARLGSAARVTSASRFSIGSVADAYLALLRRCLSR
jgi:glycosyltransferase involved in cell wall biosynthesis